MEVIKYPNELDKRRIVERPLFDSSSLHNIVQSLLDNVRLNGDRSLFEYTARFDGVELSCLSVSSMEWEEADLLVSDPLKEAIAVAKDNIYTFHRAQMYNSEKIVTTQGVECWQRTVGIEKVGLYIPGGTAPLFSTVLMLAIPAMIAGCREIILCTPPNKQGKIHPAILYAAKVAGVSKIFKLGGAQAIAAMAYGTESVPKVYKIFGPGNQYVTAAKQLVSLNEVAIDMPAGPSEVMVVADGSANAAYVASDFLSQAEHGVDSQSLLLTTDEELLNSVIHEIEQQTETLSRKEYIQQSLANSKLVLMKNKEELIELLNEYAPEHLIIQTVDYDSYVDRIINAGSVFLGPYTPESAGDYASGTNHTLPTNGYARMYSGVNMDAYVRKITFQHISKEGLQQLGPVIETLAEAEQLTAHKNAVSIRLNC